MKNINIGLALGGGVALGAAHVGVLKAIKEKNITIDHITGTSIGALAAALYAFGKDWEEIKEITANIKWINIANISLSRYGLLSNDKIGELIIEHIGDKNIEDAHIPLAIVASDVSTGKKVVLNKGSVANAVIASTCIPGIFHPYDSGDNMLIDGGIIENIPIPTLKNLGAKYIIAVDLNAHFSYSKPSNILDIILNSYHLMMAKNDQLLIADADLLIQPDLAEFSEYDLSKVEDLIQKGYEEASKTLEKLA
jgi:NTE family protein